MYVYKIKVFWRAWRKTLKTESTSPDLEYHTSSWACSRATAACDWHLLRASENALPRPRAWQWRGRRATACTSHVSWRVCSADICAPSDQTCTCTCIDMQYVSIELCRSCIFHPRQIFKENTDEITTRHVLKRREQRPWIQARSCRLEPAQFWACRSWHRRGWYPQLLCRCAHKQIYVCIHFVCRYRLVNRCIVYGHSYICHAHTHTHPLPLPRLSAICISKSVSTSSSFALSFFSESIKWISVIPHLPKSQSMMV